MNALSKVLLSVFALAVSLTAPLSLTAQPSPSERPAGAGRPGDEGRGDRLAMMSEQLGLSADQKTKVQAILESERTSLEALRADTALTPEARREKMRSIRESFAGQIRAVLTPEQQTKMSAMRGAGGPGGQAGKGGGAGAGGGKNREGRGEPKQ